MTISASAFDNVHGSFATSIDTSSKTWTSGNVYIVAVWILIVPGPETTTPTISGLTQQGTRVSADDNRLGLTIFSFLGDGATNAKTIDFGGVTQNFVEVTVDEIVGTVTTGTNATDAFVQVVLSDTSVYLTTTEASVTLSSFASGSNATWFCSCNNGGAAQTPKSGFTGLSISNGVTYLSSEYLASSDTTPNQTWTGAATSICAGIELAAAGGGTDVTLHPTGFGLTATLGTPTVTTGAISIAAFDHVGGANVSSINTNVKTWVFNHLYLVTVYDVLGTGGPVLPSVSGMTQQNTRLSVSDNRQRITLFSFLGDGTTSAKTIDLSADAPFNPTFVEVVVDDVTGSVLTGTNGSDAFVQTVTNDGNNPAPGAFDVTLAAFASGSNATWFAVGNLNGTATAKAGYTALSESNVNLALDSEYLGSPDTNPDMTGPATLWTAIGIELASPNGGSGTVTPVGFGITTTEGLLDVQLDTSVLPVGVSLTISRGAPSISIVNGGSSDITLTPIGFGLIISRGTPILQASSAVAPTGFSLTISEGTPAISGPVTIVSPTGLSMTASVGTPSTTSTHLIINPIGFGLTVFLGHPSLSGKTIQLNCLQTSGDQS